MANPWKNKVIEFNKNRKQVDEKADDLITLISAIPKGHYNQLMKDETCATILTKYRMVGEH